MFHTKPAEKFLKDGESVSIAYEMTEERKQKFEEVSDQILDLLRDKFSSPAEAYMVIAFLMKTFEDIYGIQGGIVLEKEDKPQ